MNYSQTPNAIAQRRWRKKNPEKAKQLSKQAKERHGYVKSGRNT